MSTRLLPHDIALLNVLFPRQYRKPDESEDDLGTTECITQAHFHVNGSHKTSQPYLHPSLSYFRIKAGDQEVNLYIAHLLFLKALCSCLRDFGEKTPKKKKKKEIASVHQLEILS